MTFTVENAQKSLDLFAEKLLENREYLNELDTAIGDGDHGSNMARGAEGLRDQLASDKPETLTDTFKTAALAFMSKVGGASGPLYGTAFLEIAKAGQESDQAGDLIQAGVEGLKKRGQADVGDKTMIDVWSPVAQDLGSGDLTAEKVDGYVEATAPMKAKKGRASYLGDRSIDHIDPGAMSSGLFFKAMIEAGVLDD